MISRVAAEDVAFPPIIQPLEAPEQETQHDGFHRQWLRFPKEIGMLSLW